MPHELTDLVLSRAQISLQNSAITTSCTDQGGIPSDGAHTSHVTIELPHELAGQCVPDLCDTFVSTDGKVVAAL